jgi:hypothetical protein
VTLIRFPFRAHGFDHVLVERVGAVCLVERTNPRTGSVHWEVVVLGYVSASTLPSGSTRPAGEAYPRPSEWGTHGWTYTTLKDARARFAAVVEEAGFHSHLPRSSPADAAGGTAPLPGAAAGAEEKP